MNVFDTVKSMLLGYPTLFKSRMDCLIFLFTVNGNGYSWENGELVSEDPMKIAEFRDEEKEVEKFWETTGACIRKQKDTFIDLEEGVRLSTREYNHHLKFIKDNIDLIAKRDNTFDNHTQQRVYSLSKYSQLLNLPNNISKDWQEAAETVVRHINYQEAGSFKTSNSENNLRYAKTALRLSSRIKRKRINHEEKY